MRKLRGLFFRFCGLFNKSHRDRDLAEEIESNLQLHIDDNIRAGMDPGSARRDALIKLGGVDVTKEKYRHRRGIPILETLMQDVRYAGRLLRRSPGFTATALISLALGIGANSAIFTAANAILWRTLPVSDPQSLVLVQAIREDHSERDLLPILLAQELRKSTDVLSSVMVSTSDGLSFSLDGSRAERIVGEVVSSNYFVDLGVQPFLGQGFSKDVKQGQWAAETVLSYRFWIRRFGGDPKVLGHTVLLNDYPFTVVGVSPPQFYGLIIGFEPELRLPIMPAGQKLRQMELISFENRQDNALITARLKPGIGIKQAEAACDIVFKQFLLANPDLQRKNNPLRSLQMLPGDKGRQDNLLSFREPLFILLCLAGLVLVIACTNLAGMQIARATARQRELAVRAAIGAGRWRLVRQMLVESLLLSTLGGALGFATAVWAGKMIFGLLPQGHISIVLDLDAEPRVAWFTAGLALLTGMLSGLVAALRSTRNNDLALMLKSDSASSIGDFKGARFRKALVIGQVALSLLLLSTAGLFTRTLGKLRSHEPFPQPEKVLLFTLKPQRELYNSEKMLALTAELQRRMSSLREVKAAGLAENGPMGSRTGERNAKTLTGEMLSCVYDRVSQGYFDTVGIPVVSGRDFGSMDYSGSPPVIIVNEILAGQLFKDENPLGKRIIIDGEPGNIQREIVGVVRSRDYYDLHIDPPPAIFVNIQQDRAYMPTLHIRAATEDTVEVMAAVRREFDSIDKNFPVFNIKTLQDRMDDTLSRERLIGRLAGAFGILALLLALVGIYGIMAYSVTQRKHEIGVRMALGASSGSILKMILKESMVIVGAGIVIGVPATAAAGRFISSQLSDIKIDPVALASAALIMMGIAALASFIPAQRAARIDPQIALRGD